VRVGDRLFAAASAQVGMHRPPWIGPGGSAPPRRRGHRTCAGAGAAASPSGRGSRPGTHHRVRRHRAGRTPRPLGEWWRGRLDASCSRIRSTARCSAVSIPRPNRSNFTRPAAAQSSLSTAAPSDSPCEPTRSGRTPRVDGRPSPSARMDAEVTRVVEDWRARSSTSRGRGCPSDFVTVLERLVPGPPPVDPLGEGVGVAGDSPTTFAISRNAERGR